MPESSGRGARVPLMLTLLAALAAGWGLLTHAAPAPDRPVVYPPELAQMPYQEVKVRLVLLQATVTDRRGRLVEDLQAADFRVEEEGVPQAITVFGRAADHPLEIAFLLDISGSMAVHGKLDRARGAIRRFVSALRPEDRTALMVFADGEVAVRVPFTSDRSRFLWAMDQEEAWGQTALRDALAHAAGVLADSRPGRKALVLVSDGVDNASKMNAFTAIRMARRVQVPLYALSMTGLPPDLQARAPGRHRGRSFLEVMAAVSRETGGVAFPVFDSVDVEKAVDAIQDRLRHQYLLGYHPADGVTEAGYRRIEVVAAEGRHQVLTRPGYFATP